MCVRDRYNKVNNLLKWDDFHVKENKKPSAMLMKKDKLPHMSHGLYYLQFYIFNDFKMINHIQIMKNIFPTATISYHHYSRCKTYNILKKFYIFFLGTYEINIFFV